MVRGSVIVRHGGANQELLSDQQVLEGDHLDDLEKREFLPASRTSSGGGSHEKDAQSWEARSSFVDTWVSRQDFRHPCCPLNPEEELPDIEVLNHDDVIERGKTIGLQYAQSKVTENELQNEANLTFQFNDKRLKEKVISSHISQRVDLEGNTSYTCTVCKRDFTHKSNLRYHATCAGGGTGSFPCELCHRVFKSTSHLTYHMRSVHTKERPFQCRLCDKSFHQSVKLKRHQLLHTGERPFHCDICKKSFKTNYHLKEHRNIHTTELHHPCLSCEKRFADKNNLRRHIKTYHSRQKLTCNVAECKHEAFSKHEYDLHIKEHRTLEVFPFNCKICQKGFKNKTDLQRHESTHKSNKQHVCDLCNSSFSRRDHLKRHKKRHFDGDPNETHVNLLKGGDEDEKVDEPDGQLMDWEPTHQQSPLLLEKTLHQPEPIQKQLMVTCQQEPILQDQSWLKPTKSIGEPAYPLQNSVVDLGSLQEQPFESTSQVCKAKVRGEITDLLRGITKAELRAVVAKIDSAEREALERILQSSRFGDYTESVPIPEPLERPVATTNVKKNLLNRYRKQSGYDTSKQELSSSASGFQLMPEMEVNVSQREAAADALEKWLEQKKEIRLRQEEGNEKEKETNKEDTQCRENTVIKVTPKGLRKITIFEGNFKH